MAIDRDLVIDRIQKLALARGVSEGEILARAGIKSGPRAWSRWKNDGQEPRLSNLAAIADTWKVPLPAITGETGLTTIDRLELKVDLILAHLGIDADHLDGPEAFAEAFEQLADEANPGNGRAPSTRAGKRRAAET